MVDYPPWMEIGRKVSIVTAIVIFVDSLFMWNLSHNKEGNK